MRSRAGARNEDCQISETLKAHESPLLIPQTQLAFHLRAQRDVDCRCDVHQKCRFIGQGVRESNSFSSLESSVTSLVYISPLQLCCNIFAAKRNVNWAAV